MPTWPFGIKKNELFRNREDQRMFQTDPTPDDLAVHKSLMQRLIADGEHLLGLVRQIGLPQNTAGISLESAATTVEMLQADYRGWHKPIGEREQKRILNQAFANVA